MNYANPQGALKQYRQVGVNAGIAGASPHRLVQMLLEGALERISTAKGCIQRSEVAERVKHIGGAISIVDGLRASLDRSAGGEIVINLSDLYDHMERRLLQANVASDPAILDEVTSLLTEIKSGWDAIPESVRRAHEEGRLTPDRAVANGG